MFPRTSSLGIYVNPPSRSTTCPRYPRPNPRKPRPPRVRPCTSRESRMGSHRSQTGRPHTWNISSEESCPSTRLKLSDWLGAPSRSFYWVMKRSSITAVPRASSSDASPSPKDKSYYKKYTRGLRPPCSTSSPRGECLPTRFLPANRGGRRH
jgi:hypothetical protein